MLKLLKSLSTHNKFVFRFKKQQQHTKTEDNNRLKMAKVNFYVLKVN